jgi:hypothetical protein
MVTIQVLDLRSPAKPLSAQRPKALWAVTRSPDEADATASAANMNRQAPPRRRVGDLVELWRQLAHPALEPADRH